jgi:hypothetical protein
MIPLGNSLARRFMLTDAAGGLTIVDDHKSFPRSFRFLGEAGTSSRATDAAPDHVERRIDEFMSV